MNAYPKRIERREGGTYAQAAKLKEGRRGTSNSTQRGNK